MSTRSQRAHRLRCAVIGALATGNHRPLDIVDVTGYPLHKVGATLEMLQRAFHVVREPGPEGRYRLNPKAFPL